MKEIQLRKKTILFCLLLVGFVPFYFLLFNLIYAYLHGGNSWEVSIAFNKFNEGLLELFGVIIAFIVFVSGMIYLIIIE
jgi:uncharacterized membrane protein